MNKRGFASDNNAGIHPKLLKAIVDANAGHVMAYGDDLYTRRAIQKFKEHFGKDIDVYFVWGGTGANVIGLKSITESFNGIICAESAHINVDECGAPELFTGCKLLPVRTKDGKLTLDAISHQLHGLGDQHHIQPRVISITQPTELGTVYTAQEIKNIADLAHKHGMLLHMDGARIANAAASLKVSLAAITRSVGVDVLSFGGTKNGMMYGEAVVFFNKSLSQNARYIRKQGAQLVSKMRFISAQFEALLSSNLWLKNAKVANSMAQYLGREMAKIPQVKITQLIQANAVFAMIPKKYIAKLQSEYFFYVWDEMTSEVRWMTSFDTTKQDIKKFVGLLKRLIG